MDIGAKDLETLVILNRLPKRLMIKDIKEVIAAAKAAGAVITNDARVTNVSFYPARDGKNVDYWATLSINAIVPGMIATGTGDNVTYKKGNTTTVTVPLGSVITCLFDYLIESDDDNAIDLCDYKALLYADAEKEALADDAAPYISHLHKLLNAAKLSVIARDVQKGKDVKSLFSINDRVRKADNDSVWHDIYGLNGVREKRIAEALAYCVDANAKNAAADTNESKASAYDALLAAYRKNSAADAVSAALG